MKKQLSLRIADRNLYRAKYLGRNRVIAECAINDTIFLDSHTEDLNDIASDTKVMAALKSHTNGPN